MSSAGLQAKTLSVLLLLIVALFERGYGIEDQPSVNLRKTQRDSHTVANFPKPHAVHELSQLPRRAHAKKRELDEGPRGTELAPLFPGYGTHFSYVYVGTPAQRQSLIVDTGSHYTAFPCVGCSKCGKHTDPYWNMKASTSAVVLQCPAASGQTTCEIEQSYTEGSSWKAFKVRDKLWVGSINPTLVPNAQNYTMDFEFGCQTSETGLFESQLADGIMGLSNSPDTLPKQLKEKKITATNLFALCFRIGGGIMTLGGVDTRIHSKRTVSYAAMVDPGRQGWFGVNLVSVLMRPTNMLRVPLIPISPNNSYFLVPPPGAAPGAAVGGAIVDSGTTDTYLPAAAAADFKALLKKASNGLDFKEKGWLLKKEDLRRLPTIVFRLQGIGEGAAAAAAAASAAAAANQSFTFPPSTTIDIVMPWNNYLDNVGEDLYNVRIGFTEAPGAVVLGSNFMTGYNVIFDSDAGKIGFVASECNYEEFDPLKESSKGGGGDDKPALDGGSTDGGGSAGSSCSDFLIPSSECTAVCSRNETGYTVKGSQVWRHHCKSNGVDLPTVTKDCFENCAFNRIVRGADPLCPDKPWTECTHGCMKSRQVVPSTEKPRDKNGNCNYKLQTATCYSGICPLQDGDYLVYIDLRVSIEPWKWSYVHSESFFAAMASLFKVKRVCVFFDNS